MPATPANGQIFTEIFETNHWGSTESVSGPGAELRQTHQARSAVAAVLDRFDVRTLVDIGCGDMNWVRRVSNIDRLAGYIGLDIVPGLVESNRARHSDSRYQLGFKESSQHFRFVLIVGDC